LGFSQWLQGHTMLKILIVEDDAQLATTLKYLVEDNPRYRVIARADDLDSAVAAAEDHNPDLALVDLQLARGSTGFSVAVRLGDFDIPCLFVTGKAPAFPMPDLALGCLLKPFTAEDVHRTLAMAEDVMRGRETLRPKLPPNLLIYDGMDAHDVPPAGEMATPGFIPSRRSFKTRIEHWIAGTQA
jgi:two-component system, response regulator PdtaR